MPIGTLALHLHIPGCFSLKDKRSRLKALIARLQREFNISAAEMDYQDTWTETLLGCAMISNDTSHIQRSLQQIPGWIEHHWPDVSVVSQEIEII